MQNNKPRWRTKLRAGALYDKEIPLRVQLDAQRLWRQTYNYRPSNFHYDGFSEVNGKKLPKFKDEASVLKVLVISSQFLASIDDMRRSKLTNKELKVLVKNGLTPKQEARIWRLSNGRKRSIIATLIKATKRTVKQDHALNILLFQRMFYISERLRKGKKISKPDMAYLKLVIDKF